MQTSFAYTMESLQEIAIADLLLDIENARLSETQANQHEVFLSIASLNPDHMLNLAASIVEKGVLDPLANPAVVSVAGQKKKYLVVEGNRRIAAVKALDNPALIGPVLSESQRKKLKRLADRYGQNPVSHVACALFDSIEEAEYWVTLRHTGENQGVGLKNWGPDEQDNWNARHGRRTHYVQMMDFVDKFYELDAQAQASSQRIKTNLLRIVKTIKDDIGLVRKNKTSSTYYPAEEAAKILGYLVAILKKDVINVNDIREEGDRKAFLKDEVPDSVMPDPATRLPTAVPLDDYTFGRVPPSGKVDGSEGSANGDDSEKETDTDDDKKKNRRKKSQPPRSALIPTSCYLEIARPRINNIYVELARISHNDYTDAVSVLLRVFLELSTDFYIEVHDLIPEKDGKRRRANLAKKLKAVANDLRTRGEITQHLQEAIRKMADNDRYIHASVFAFHQYVHNMHAAPVASELESIWDVTLQPFLEKVFA